mgnify:CR=1 FL=1
MNILITSESSCDIPAPLLRQHGIHTVAFSVNFPNRTVADNSIPVEDIFDFFNRTRTIPKTSAVNPDQYTAFWDGLLAEQPDAVILHVGYSSACSCSFQNARIGREDCKAPERIRLVDSLNVSCGLGSLVLKAVQLRAQHPDDDLETLARRVEGYVPKARMVFVPDRLDFLAAGGRVSNAAALGASILRLKPRIDIIAGELIAGRKYRGSMARIVPHLLGDFLQGRNFDLSQAYLIHAAGAAEAALTALREGLRAHGFESIHEWQLGCVMTVHGGRGAVGLSAIER